MAHNVYMEGGESYDEILLKKRIEFVQNLKRQLSIDNSIATDAVALYSDLIEGASKMLSNLCVPREVNVRKHVIVSSSGSAITAMSDHDNILFPA